MTRFVVVVAPGLLVGLLVWLILPPYAKAQFDSPPPYTKRISENTLLVEPGGWKHAKDKICPGHDNGIDNVTKRPDGSRVVLCAEYTFFSPEVPSASGKEAPFQTVARYIKVPSPRVVTHIRTAPVVAMTVIYLVIGVISGAILGSVVTLVKTRS